MTPELPVILTLMEAVGTLCGDSLDRALRVAERNLSKLPSEPGVRSGIKAKSFDPLTIHRQMRWHEAHRAVATELSVGIARGEFHLCGSKEPSTASEAAVILTRRDIRIGRIQPGTNTIEVEGETYKDVYAVLGPPPTPGEAEHRRLAPVQAICSWCHPGLVANVRSGERTFRTDEIGDFGLPQLGSISGKNPVGGRTAEQHLEARRWLESRWEDLLKDMQTRVASGEIYLYGVQTNPTLATDYQRIPATWAFDLQIDVKARSVVAHDHRWTAVECSLDALDFGTEAARQEARTTLTPENVGELSDDTILSLLEEHAERVVKGPDARLIAPGKVSLLPIVKRKMEYRATQGILLPKIADEAEVLADWIASKVKAHPVPTASTIAKMLGKKYAALKARSTAAIQNPRD